MGKTLHAILDWSEVWGALIPVIAFFILKPRQYWRRPIVVYVFVSFVLNLVIDLIWQWNIHHTRSIDNGLYYNILSIVRFFLFSWFFRVITGKKTIYQVVEIAFILLALLVFVFVKPPDTFNSPLLACEAAVLLFYCLHFFYSTLREDKDVFNSAAIFVVSGLTLYTAVNFFIFLFYNYLSKAYRAYAIGVWDIHNITYIIFCIFIARAFKNSKAAR
jgi:hypothetical protein